MVLLPLNLSVKWIWSGQNQTNCVCKYGRVCVDTAAFQTEEAQQSLNDPEPVWFCC